MFPQQNFYYPFLPQMPLYDFSSVFYNLKLSLSSSNIPFEHSFHSAFKATPKIVINKPEITPKRSPDISIEKNPKVRSTPKKSNGD